MTTSDQDRIVEALASEHGAAHVLPYSGDVLACGWDDDHRVGPWLYVYGNGRTSEATRFEVAYALEASDRRNSRIPLRATA
jgi:hypothetical protein